MPVIPSAALPVSPSAATPSAAASESSSLPKPTKVNRCALCAQITKKRCGRCESERYCCKGKSSSLLV